MRRAQSYTSISIYEKCPKAWKSRYIDKVRGPQSQYANRGDQLHSLLEKFFLGQTPYPSGNKTLAPWQRFMENLTLYNPTPEFNSAVDEHWLPTGYDDPNCYLRGKADLRYTRDGRVHILDWKSGRVYPDHPKQGKLYIALDDSFAEDYETEFVYLDMPTQTVPRRYKIEDKMVERRKLDNIIHTIEQDTEYKATPSMESCKYCHLSWRAGGECKSAP